MNSHSIATSGCAQLQLCDLLAKTCYSGILQPRSVLQAGGKGVVYVPWGRFDSEEQALLTLPAERGEECTLPNVPDVILGGICGTSTCSTEHQRCGSSKIQLSMEKSCTGNKSMQPLPAKARVSWCSWWEEKRMEGLMSFVVKFSHGGVNSVCLSADCISMSSITWKSWGYLSGESQASSSGLKGTRVVQFKREEYFWKAIKRLSVYSGFSYFICHCSPSAFIRLLCIRFD